RVSITDLAWLTPAVGSGDPQTDALPKKAGHRLVSGCVTTSLPSHMVLTPATVLARFGYRA
ncbi:MAG: hypothetical protein VX234_09950, partial [Pseudomonadota bacterium]|nr:hypothetical protein [Pseudomonadota bacterium]